MVGLNDKEANRKGNLPMEIKYPTKPVKIGFMSQEDITARNKKEREMVLRMFDVMKEKQNQVNKNN